MAHLSKTVKVSLCAQSMQSLRDVRWELRLLAIEQITYATVREMSTTHWSFSPWNLCRTLKSQGCFPFCSRVEEEPESFIGLTPPHLWLLYPNRLGKGLFLWPDTQAPINRCVFRVLVETHILFPWVESLLALWVWICSVLMLSSEWPSLSDPCPEPSKSMTHRATAPPGLKWHVYSRPLLQHLPFSF